MKQLKTIIFMGIIASWPGKALAAITHVQQCTDTSQYNGTGFASNTCNFSGGTAAGNTIIVSCQFGSSNATITVSDTNGDVFIEATNAHQWNAGDIEGESIFYSVGVAAGSTWVKCSYSPNTNFQTIAAHEYSGISGFDVGAGAQGNTGAGGSNDATVGPMTTTADGDLIYVAQVDTTNTSFTATAGTNSLSYGLRANISATGSMADEDAIQTTHGSVTGSMTDSNLNANYAISMASFKAKVAGGASIAAKIGGGSHLGGGKINF